MKFNQLRLAGFKSFLEPTELLIKDGLTGIVGPNGCGKSNLVEALRWVMGEASAKNMRGGAMDDVIFAGTTSRPPRNMAEVSLSLDNNQKNAPVHYNDLPDIDVTRRIKRDAGSDYRINGKICRAKDVQLLFADMSTGAHSTAIVSQGRVGSLINAQPRDRRHLLEEAAGITGLHARRREAELRLQSAETNLERIDDNTEHLNVQLDSLKRQSRQATRYSNLSSHIRMTDALLLYCKQEQACTIEKTAKAHLADTHQAVKTLTEQVSAAQANAIKAAAILPPLRQKEMDATALVQKISLSLENLIAEEGRLKTAHEQLENRKTQTASDIAREETLERDAALALGSLEDENTQLLANRDLDAPLLSAQQKTVQSQQKTLHGLQQDFDKNFETLAANKATSSNLTFQQSNLTRSLDRLKARYNENIAEITKFKGARISEAASTEMPDRISTLTTDIETATKAILEIEKNHIAADLLERELRDLYQETAKQAANTNAEISALRSLLYDDTQQEWASVLASLTVKRGFEAALGAALGEELEASLEETAPAYWGPACALKGESEFIKNIPTLDEFVTGEPALQARLSQVGVVAQNLGPELAAMLSIGQRLVSKEGDLWRWDGYVRKAGALTPSALRLEQHNKLGSLKTSLEIEQSKAKEAKEKLSAASMNLSEISAEEKSLRATRRSNEERLSRMLRNNEETIREAATKQFRLQVLEDLAGALTEEIAEIENQLKELSQDIQSLSDIDASQAEHNELRENLELHQKELDSYTRTYDLSTRESYARNDRLKGIKVEKSNWSQRLENMSGHKTLLQARFISILDELDDLKKKPEKIAADRRHLVEQASRAKELQASAHANLTEADSILMDCNAALLLSQNSLSTCREQRVRHQAEVEHAEDALKSLAEQIYEKLECPPEHIKKAGGIKDGMEIPPLEVSQKKLDRLKTERDNMGPVNLRAHIEATEVDAQLTSLIHEKADLEAAIRSLRQAIGSLNKEGRERLLTAFDHVNTHFKNLFKQVFGGGHAHLTLTESDDPLAAGLEIMASPPGKNLQLMSLLSGGEQALTAVALLFAVFLTNPAPICVLDEVDAPLDDANVQRLCNLLDKISENAETRFLVVTHHPITMARMDRLFGVTMAERGVSQLVSVDLGKARLMTERTAQT
ncbi:MAG: chromosome segregation protein SMC [Sneathiella sp.]